MFEGAHPPSPVQLPARACFLSSPSAPWAGEGAEKGSELGVQAVAGLGNCCLKMNGIGKKDQRRAKNTTRRQMDRQRVLPKGV